MYNYLDDKKLISKMRNLGGSLMQRLCHYLKEDHNIGATFYLVGSGAKNLILQNANNPVDLDYNLEIVRCNDFEDGRYLKECVKETFDKCLHEYNLAACEDSTSSLTSKMIFFKTGNRTGFNIDVCITKRDKKGVYYRLIHQKTGWVKYDRYYWNEAPCSEKLRKKADYIKRRGRWSLVRQEYLRIKNYYLRWNDKNNHPSFICYTEAVNNVYNSIKQR